MRSKSKHPKPKTKSTHQPPLRTMVVAGGGHVVIENKSTRRIPLDMKLSVLADIMSGLPATAIIERYGISNESIRKIRDDMELRSILDPNLVKSRKNNIANLFIYKAIKAQDHVTDKKLEESSALQLTTMSAINYDKHRLAEGLSTENLSVKGVVEDLHLQHKRLAEREAQLAQELGE